MGGYVPWVGQEPVPGLSTDRVRCWNNHKPSVTDRAGAVSFCGPSRARGPTPRQKTLVDLSVVHGTEADTAEPDGLSVTVDPHAGRTPMPGPVF